MTSPTLNNAVRGRALTLLVHADTKVGKSTLAATCPKPMVLFDAEAAYRFLDIKKTFWNPLTEAPPRYDGTWDVCVVKVLDYTTLQRGVEWLVSGQHHFKSAAVDSISEIQKRFKNSLTDGGGNMDQRTWGALLDGMEYLCRTLRDLTEHPTTPLEAVVMTAMTEMRDGKWRPYVQGQLRVTMPYFLDIIGYMDVYEHPNADPTIAPQKYRRMIIGKTPLYESGERVGGKLGEVVYDPNVANMIEKIFPTPVVPSVTEPVAAQ